MSVIQNALTVDVEDYFHVSAFANTIKRQDWGLYESRIEANTNKLLDIFDRGGHKATFFILGWIAERYPRLVQQIAERGHEVACHGFAHELIYKQHPETFRADTLRAKSVLEDITARPVCGYRAASFSITQRSAWALDILAESGFAYDSSIFPIRHDHYGLPGALRHPCRLKTLTGGSIVEFPLSTVEVFGLRLPVSGGGYFRLLPYDLNRKALERINNKERQPFIFYLHPWEIDPQQPRVSAGWLSRFRHYNNLHKCEHRLGRLLDDFSFGTATETLRNLRLLD